MTYNKSLMQDNKKIRNRLIILIILLISIILYKNLTAIKPVDYSDNLIKIEDLEESIALSFKRPITSYLTFTDDAMDDNGYKIISIQPYYTVWEKLIGKYNNYIVIDKSKYDVVIYNSPNPYGSKILYDPNNYFENSGTEYLPRKGLNLLTMLSAIVFLIFLLIAFTIFRKKNSFKKLKIVQIPLCLLISTIIVNVNRQGTYTYEKDMILLIITYIVVHLLVKNYINYEKQNHKRVKLSNKYM